jgi:hypothetical protein
MSAERQTAIGGAISGCLVLGACTLDVSGLPPQAEDGGPVPMVDAGAVVHDAGAMVQDAAEVADAGTDACVGAACLGVEAGCDGVETCNAADDDCDGVVDEGGSLCGDTCTTATSGGSSYLFCSDTSNWDDSRDYCAARGYDLVIVGDNAENAFVTAVADDVRAGEWWIGLRLSDPEGEYEWVDGVVADFTAWETEMPSGECVRMRTSDGLWAGKGCGGSRAFVCEAAR